MIMAGSITPPVRTPKFLLILFEETLVSPEVSGVFPPHAPTLGYASTEGCISTTEPFLAIRFMPLKSLWKKGIP